MKAKDLIEKYNKNDYDVIVMDYAGLKTFWFESVLEIDDCLLELEATGKKVGRKIMIKVEQWEENV